jgi:hypothetical protein
LNFTRLDNRPLSDHEIDSLPDEDLMMAYLVANTTPEQRERMLARIKAAFPGRKWAA